MDSSSGKEVKYGRFRLVTKATRAETVLERWEEQYRYYLDNPEACRGFSWSVPETHEKLKALKRPTVKEVETILNPSWTSIECDVCAKRVEKAVAADFDEQDRGVTICMSCLRSAAKHLSEK